MLTCSNNTNIRSMSSPPPAPSGQALHLISALIHPEPANQHIAALQARDDALSASVESYTQICLQFCYTLIGCDQPQALLNRMDPQQLHYWQTQDARTVAKLMTVNLDEWIPFGQMAGLLLKNALIRPPPSTTIGVMTLPIGHATTEQLKASLLYALQNVQQPALRKVVSSVVAVTSVGSIQPALQLQNWPQLWPTLWNDLQPSQDGTQGQDGALSTLHKMMEDGPTHMDPGQLDLLVPALLRFLQTATTTTTTTAAAATTTTTAATTTATHPHSETTLLHALQILCTCLTLRTLPNALILQFQTYLQSLSALATTQAHRPRIVQWVCRTLVTMLELRTEYLQTHFDAVARFLLLTCQQHAPSSTNTNLELALEACEFWLTFATHVSEAAMTPHMLDTVQSLLPELIPVLLQGMVYPVEQRVEILARNEMDATDDASAGEHLRPIFHRSRAGPPVQSQSLQTQASSSLDSDFGNDSQDDDDNDDHDRGYEQDDERGFGDETDMDDDDGGHDWTLRKCSAASLDALANLYGAEPILPALLPALEQGLSLAPSSTSSVEEDAAWVQEACILALGAVAEGCSEAMNVHLTQLHPYLLNNLQLPPSHNQNSNNNNNNASLPLPQVSCIAAWTLGRYVPWAVDEVQSGRQGHLLAQMTEVFLSRLMDPNRRVQVAICSAFGHIVEAAGDLMAPYLEPIYRALVTALGAYRGRSLLVLLDLLGNMADCCGPAIAEGELPSIYVPPLVQMWNHIATQDPTNKTLLPLMEALASIAMISGMNFQPYALECFENAMSMIEAVQLILASHGETIENEEDADPVVCAVDLLDGLVEGTGSSFPALLASSQRFQPHFLSVVHTLCDHEVAGVRMSALALVGDLAKTAPTVLESALGPMMETCLKNMSPSQPTVCTNAVWAVGEILVHCEGNAPLIRPFASTLVQNLIPLLVGNGVGMGNRGTDIPGLAENTAACVGRLAKVDPSFVATDLPRFLLGWCDGMAKIVDPVERHDAFAGFIQALYANPQAIQNAALNVPDAVASVLFAFITWHMPPDLTDRSVVLLNGDYSFLPFPSNEAELGSQIHRLIVDMKSFVGEENWITVQKNLPVNVRRLLRECYQL